MVQWGSLSTGLIEGTVARAQREDQNSMEIWLFNYFDSAGLPVILIMFHET